jgi:hypothetical protein
VDDVLARRVGRVIVTLRTGKVVNHVATPLGMRLLREH